MILSDLLKAGALGKAGSFHLQGKSGVLEAKVIRLLSASKAELLIQGRKVTAELGDAVEIKKGDLIQLKQGEGGALSITKERPHLSLIQSEVKPGHFHAGPSGISQKSDMPGLLSPEMGLVSSLRDTLNFFLTQPKPPFDALTQLTTHFELTTPSSHESPPLKSLGDALFEAMHQVALKSDQADLNFIPRLLQQGGMLFEKKLATLESDPSIQISQSEKGDLLDFKVDLKGDLKSIAMQLLETVDERKSDMGPAPEWVKTESFNADSIKAFLQTFEKVQLLNSHLADSGKYLIPFPIFSGGDVSFGQLYFDLGGKNEDEAESRTSKSQRILNVSLFLDMSALGPIRADFSMLENQISGAFQVTDPEVADLFHRMLPELRKNLQRHDYQVKGIFCKLVPPKKLNDHTLINDLIQDQSIPSDGSLNVII